MRTTPEGGAGGTSLRARPNNTGTPAITTASPTTGKLYTVCCKVFSYICIRVTSETSCETLSMHLQVLKIFHLQSTTDIVFVSNCKVEFIICV